MAPSPSPLKRVRHRPQRGAPGVTWSGYEDAQGNRSKVVYEVRHSHGNRPYEVVGARLDAAKARAREINGDSAPPVTKVGLTTAELIARYCDVRGFPRIPASDEERALIPHAKRDEYRALEQHIQPRWGRTKLRDITWSDIASWVSGLKRKDGRPGPLAEGSKRLVLARFSALLEYAIEIGALGVNPVKAIPRKRRPKAGEERRRILTHDEDDRLYAYSAPFPWLRDIVTVAEAQALRLGEVLGLSVEDVDFENGKVRVHRSLERDGTLGATKHTKLTGKRDPRDVNPIDLMPQAREVLLRLRMDVSEGLFFRNKLGGPRQRRDVQRAFDKARTRAALAVTQDGPVVFHSLRHTTISRLANNPEVGVVYARDFAGHSSLEVTNGYVHKVESAERTAAAARALAG